MEPTRSPGRIASAVVGIRALALAAIALAAGPAVAGGPGDPFDLRAACRDDFQRLCAELGAEAARGAILRCLETHEAELSPACRIAVGEAEDPDPDRTPPSAPHHPKPRPAPTIP